MEVKVIVHLVHGGNKSLVVSKEVFDKEINEALSGLDNNSDGNTGFFGFDNAIIPVREIKYIEWERVVKSFGY
ncbi:hypothetical protein [Priestia taiwanensis]|uniref:Uncharacterized protein n=1 Tax=Priestia taiwanensis TaxID=1347902 RepID=A0A917AK62_9BACI|nr:hypothetical protein [Priestia taiwanensis]MBM7361981.1 hypothetical protein [Priestia taiwanensis]GGE58509.1 hypothetical protein GCM10007140_06070 [Priestia taiwanensis]